jgi:three-Cys-motif partner protein
MAEGLDYCIYSHIPAGGRRMAPVDEDGLLVSEAGAWTLEKHARLRKYVDAAHGARRRFRGRTSYIDLYCGPGRVRIRETGDTLDGSPLVAWEAGGRYGDQFGEFLLADDNPASVAAAKQRLESRGAKVRAFAGRAEAVVRQVVAALDRRGLHFAFLDPYNLDDLPFAVIEELAKLRRMDLLIHVSAMDLKRNLRAYLDSAGNTPLDRFAPNWRKAVDARQRDELVRLAVLEHWKGLISRLGTFADERVEGVENSKGVELYWLVLVARSKLAHKLWGEIANVGPQGRLPLG